MYQEPIFRHSKNILDYEEEKTMRETWKDIGKSSAVSIGIEPHIMRVWIDSSAEQTFEEQIAEADAIVVGGGNTLNMLGIWQAD